MTSVTVDSPIRHLSVEEWERNYSFSGHPWCYFINVYGEKWRSMISENDRWLSQKIFKELRYGNGDEDPELFVSVGRMKRYVEYDDSEIPLDAEKNTRGGQILLLRLIKNAKTAAKPDHILPWPMPVNVNLCQNSTQQETHKNAIAILVGERPVSLVHTWSGTEWCDAIGREPGPATSIDEFSEAQIFANACYGPAIGGGCQMLRCCCYEEDDDEHWFTGQCFECGKIIEEERYAVRLPRFSSGCWYGTYCCIDHTGLDELFKTDLAAVLRLGIFDVPRK
jgi:hypothetical protein